MTKNVTKFLITFALIFMSFPLRVFADSPTGTYVVLDGCLIYSLTNGNYNYYGSITYNSNTSEMRAVVLNHGSSIALFIVSAHDFRYKNNNKDNSCAVGNSTPTLTDGYYVARAGQSNYGSGFTGNVPIVDDTVNFNNAVKYTFGDGAVAPDAEIPDYGDLILNGYKTNIAGSGNAAVNNKDTISWEPVDTNGNDITNCQVTIRAVPGQYSAESKASLLEKSYSDFVLNTLNATQLGTYPAREQSHAFTWGNVISVLNLPFLSISSMIKRDETWIKNGWIYQIRLEDEENNYIGEWQTVYTGTAAGVKNDLTIINSTTLNQDLINVITSINNRNEVTNNWTIINIIIVPNPDPTPTPEPGTDPGSDSNWLSALLQAIVDLISGILSFLGGIVQSIIDGILGLFSFDDFELYDILSLFNDEVNQQNLIGQTYFFWDQVIETAKSMRSQDPIINWPGITIMGVDLIPAAAYNLNDYVSQLGLTDLHNLVYTVTDGSIAICLLWLIHKKIMAVLHL